MPSPERKRQHQKQQQEEQEDDSPALFHRSLLRHVAENGSARRKRRLALADPYVRHPSERDFVFGLHFRRPSAAFLTYLARAPQFRGRLRHYNAMPALQDGLQMANGPSGAPPDELLNATDTEQSAGWDAAELLRKQYLVSIARFGLILGA